MRSFVSAQRLCRQETYETHQHIFDTFIVRTMDGVRAVQDQRAIARESQNNFMCIAHFLS